MHEKVLRKAGVKLLHQLEGAKSPWLKHWTLAGGTGLALHLGHRVSDDFDFFRTDKMDVSKLHRVFAELGPYRTLQEAEDTLTILSHQTKVSFFVIRDPFVAKGMVYRFFTIANVIDIALMKLLAISSRGSRRDFVDLYMILRGGLTLSKCFELLPKKYGKGPCNLYHIAKSLTYFDDAESEPIPKMLVPFDWKECKGFFVRESTNIVMG